jgi:hypothetical protein
MRTPDSLAAALGAISTATLTSVLLKKGFGNVFIRAPVRWIPSNPAAGARLYLALRAGARGPGDA